MPADDVGHCRSAALVRHVDHLGSGLELEQFAREVLRRAVAGGGEHDLARLLLGESDELLRRLGRHGRVYDEDQRHRADDRDRREVLLKVEVRCCLLQGGIDRVAGQSAHEQRIAIRLRPRRRSRPEIAAGPCPVVDHHLLAEPLRQLLRQHAADDVSGTTCRVGHDHHDGPGRVGIGEDGAGHHGDPPEGEQDDDPDHACHAVRFPLVTMLAVRAFIRAGGLVSFGISPYRAKYKVELTKGIQNPPTFPLVNGSVIPEWISQSKCPPFRSGRPTSSDPP